MLINELRARRHGKHAAGMCGPYLDAFLLMPLRQFLVSLLSQECPRIQVPVKHIHGGSRLPCGTDRKEGMQVVGSWQEQWQNLKEKLSTNGQQSLGVRVRLGTGMKGPDCKLCVCKAKEKSCKFDPVSCLLYFFLHPEFQLISVFIELGSPRAFCIGPCLFLLHTRSFNTPEHLTRCLCINLQKY